jgi:hypothetical protein
LAEHAVALNDGDPVGAYCLVATSRGEELLRVVARHEVPAEDDGRGETLYQLADGRLVAADKVIGRVSLIVHPAEPIPGQADNDG